MLDEEQMDGGLFLHSKVFDPSISPGYSLISLDTSVNHESQ